MKLNKRAIALGVIIDMCWSFLIMFSIGVFIGIKGISEVAAKEFVKSDSLQSVAFMIVFAGVGTILAGYITAQKAGHSKIKHALWVGIIPALFSVIGALVEWDGIKLMLVAAVISNPLLASLGGFLNMKYPKVKNASETEVKKDLDKKMFYQLTNFGYERSVKQAIGFYFSYLLLIVLILFIVGALNGIIMSALGIDIEQLKEIFFTIGVIAATIMVTILTTIILLKKKSFNFMGIITILISCIATIFGGGVLGLIVSAYTTTFKMKSVDAIEV